jgi:hypothetical protein
MERKNHKPRKNKKEDLADPKQSQEVSDLEVAKKMIKIHQSAMDRKLEFNLSFETVKKLLGYQTCYYTNKKFEEEGNYARSFDRIDSSKGYVEGNVVACTVDINGKKANLSMDEIECLYKKLVTIQNKVEKAPKKEAKPIAVVIAEPAPENPQEEPQQGDI